MSASPPEVVPDAHWHMLLRKCRHLGMDFAVILGPDLDGIESRLRAAGFGDDAVDFWQDWRTRQLTAWWNTPIPELEN